MVRSRFLFLFGAGVFLRALIFFLSTGTNDVVIWRSHAALILAHGVGYAYQTRDYFNHPPLMWLWSAFCLRLTGDLRIFSHLIKLPGLVGEVLSGAILWRLRGERGLAAYACSLISILISTFHGNTDALVAGFCLLAFYEIDRERFFFAGLAYAAALNVKVLPLVLLPAAFAAIMRPRDMLRFCAGAAFAVIPFLPFVITDPHLIYLRIFAYNSAPDNWGFLALFHAAENFWPRVTTLDDAFRIAGRYLIFIVNIAFVIRARRRGQTNPYFLASACLCFFFFFAPGFSVQYLVVLAPILFAWSLRDGIIYATLSGVFVLAVYISYGIHWDPISVTFTSHLLLVPALLGLVVWIFLGALPWRNEKLVSVKRLL